MTMQIITDKNSPTGFSDGMGNDVDDMGNIVAPVKSVSPLEKLITDPKQYLKDHNPLNPGQEVPLSQFAGEAAQTAKPYIPMAAGAVLTGLLGPEAGYPTYAAVGGLSQGGAQALMNKMSGKDAFDTNTMAQGALGTIGGLVQKPMAQIGNWLGTKLGLTKLFNPKADSTSLELANSIFDKKLSAGPEVQQSLENFMPEYLDTLGNKGLGKTGDQIANLRNQPPLSIARSNVPDVADLGMDAMRLVDDQAGKATAWKMGLGGASNLGAQSMLSDKLKQLLSQ